MARFVPFFLIVATITIIIIVMVYATDPSEENGNSTQIKVNGKTYFFQLRKDTTGNDTTYKRAKEYLSGVPEGTDDVDFVINEESKRYRHSPFESLKSRRRELMKLERSTYGYSSQFLDDEWKYNLNNQYVEVPQIARQLYESVQENSQKMHANTSSVIRFLFETSAQADGTVGFNLNALKNKTDEVLADAELHIYRMSENDENGGDVKHSSNQVIRLYQIVPVSDTGKNATRNPDVHKLLNVIYVSSQQSGWQVFKVKNVVENWLNGEDNLGFLLAATDTWENVVPLTIGRKRDGQHQPILVVYLNAKTHRDKKTSSATSPDPKQVAKYINLSKDANILPTSPTPCARHVWYVSFQELGWSNFVISPSGFMAFRCKGSCMSPAASPFTNHGKLTNAYHVSFSFLKRPCCVPDTFKTLPVMFYDKSQNIVIKTYEDMVVESCACR